MWTLPRDICLRHDKYSCINSGITRLFTLWFIIYLYHKLFASHPSRWNYLHHYHKILLLKLHCFFFLAFLSMLFGIIEMNKSGQDNVSCGKQYDALLSMINYTLHIIFLLYMFPLSFVIYVSSIFYLFFLSSLLSII